MNGWSWYWLWWSVLAATTFILPEGYALVTRNYSDTLSDNVWRLEKLMPGQTVWQWTALHVLFAGTLTVLLAWLLLHLVFGIWR